MQQRLAFMESEGDAWYKRNRHKMERDDDIPLRVIALAEVQPRRVLEVGASNGWRLERLRQRYGSSCIGIDPSKLAHVDGRSRFPSLDLRIGTMNYLDLFAGAFFDLIIVSFVLHWLDRSEVFQTVTELNRLIAPGGHLLIADFLPDGPTKTPYHHRPGLWTYKENYAAYFPVSQYREVERVIFNHDTYQIGEAPPNERAVCVLLQKGDYYCVSE